MKFRTIAVAVFLACSLQLYAQQVDSASRTMLQRCLGRPCSPSMLMNHPWKPALGGVQTSRPSTQPAHHDDGATYVTFDAPGSVNGTFAVAISPEGTITGWYWDANFVAHGFLRAPNGSIATFDAPGDVNGTSPSAINRTGDITGYYADANFVGHGFLRARDGSVTTFDAPDDVNGTYPSSLNSAGDITGAYWDLNFVSHGFLRDRHGAMATFDVPEAGVNTFPSAINSRGVVWGCYLDANFVGHGFLRDRDGDLTRFDVPYSTNMCAGLTIAGNSGESINDAGTVTGAYFEPIQGNPFGGNWRGFVRTHDGSFATFDAATYSPCCIWTFSQAINPDGTTTGYDNDGYNAYHGFVRTKDGTVTTFDVPGAGTGYNQGTIATAINPSGAIAGSFIDASGIFHSFLRITCDERDADRECGKNH